MKHTVEARKKISRNNAKYWLGKKRPELSKARMGRNNPMYGRKATLETRKKMSEAHSGSKSGSWKGGLPSCLSCKSKLSRYDAKYCAEHVGISRSGDRSYNWKGGVTAVEKKQRTKFGRIMRDKVFERDDYTCQNCNERGGELHVDHIKSWAEHVELRFDMDNCTTLCKSCHYQKTYKRKMPDGIAWGRNLSRRIA